MIRWRFLLTRVILVVAIMMILALGLGPMATYVTIAGLETTTGAKAEIGSAKVGLFPPSIHYADVRVADPRDGKEFRDAFVADSVDLTIDGDAFLRRRWVIRQGKITGLQIGSQRDSSGQYDREVDSADEPDSPSMISKMLTQFTSGLSDQAEAIGEDLETVKTGEEIRVRWKEEYADLLQQARDLEQRVKTIRDAAKGIDNPLRDWPELERTLAEARSAREELLRVRAKLDALPDEMQADLARLEEARKADLAKVDAYVPGDLSESKNFGVDLIAAEIRRSLAQLRGYLDNGRTLANYTVVAPDSERIRGEDFDFLGQRRQPEMLIRECHVDGLMRADGKTYALTGVVENMTPQPELLQTPTRARLLLEGPETVQVDYVRDRREGDTLDRLTLHWPQMLVDPVRLGDGSDVAVAISGGQREVWVQLNSHGDDVQGRLVSKQVGVNMHIAVDGDAANSAAVVSMNQSLANVNTIEVDAAFTGNWKELDLDLNTNLGNAFSDAAKGAIAKQLEVSKAKLAAKVEAVHREQMLSMREWMSKQQTEAQTLLASADRSIEEMSQKVLAEVGDADSYLGKLRTSFGKSLR
ncbi:TIGR03545 family protein [Aporhodopirellula aestuarii]|uniref:TIGR03545 family protein n=1 Tax=Aporhodopirellula aestuarii TaxID=2950107 RepID=A0ABT0UCD6_9BACT|nr:TIGR03545 family protein [Aporhodopirellula aestuarii]MCM2374477.1 TIGR03545 family protein [Aporhodopirellula aestuarii]